MITEKQFAKFEEIRSLGGYNMVTECELVRDMIDLTLDEYMELLANYDDLRDEYGDS